MRHLVLGIVAAALLLIAAPAARAGTLACALAEAGSIDVDGMLDDWQGVAPARAGGKDSDASFDLRCLFDGARLAIAIDVRDDRLVRIFGAKGKKLLGEDRVVVELTAGGGKPLALTLYPGTARIKPRRLAAGRPAPPWIAVEDTGQKRGWSIELELPLARLPGWSAGVAAVAANVTLHDADVHDEVATQAELPLAIDLGLGERPQLIDRFLKDLRLKKKDVVLDQLADLDRGQRGKERVVVAGRILGVLTEQYAYVELPVERASDVLRVEVVDLRGDGSAVVLAHLRQRGGGGVRDVVSLWGADGGRIEPVLAVEVRKEADGNRLESSWKLVPAGTRRKVKGKKPRGLDLVVEAKPAVGWDEDTFDEIAAEDAEPIHRPWDPARTGGVYWLDGDTVRSQPLGARNPRKP